MSSREVLAIDDYGVLKYEINEVGTILLHFEVIDGVVLTPSILKHWKKEFQNIKKYLYSKGYTEIFTIVDKNDIKVNKFQLAFGFEPKLEINNAVIYRQEVL